MERERIVYREWGLGSMEGEGMRTKEWMVGSLGREGEESKEGEEWRRTGEEGGG